MYMDIYLVINIIAVVVCSLGLIIYPLTTLQVVGGITIAGLITLLLLQFIFINYYNNGRI